MNTIHEIQQKELEEKLFDTLEKEIPQGKNVDWDLIDKGLRELIKALKIWPNAAYYFLAKNKQYFSLKKIHDDLGTSYFSFDSQMRRDTLKKSPEEPKSWSSAPKLPRFLSLVFKEILFCLVQTIENEKQTKAD